LNHFLSQLVALISRSRRSLAETHAAEVLLRANLVARLAPPIGVSYADDLREFAISPIAGIVAGPTNAVLARAALAGLRVTGSFVGFFDCAAVLFGIDAGATSIIAALIVWIRHVFAPIPDAGG